MLKLLLRAGAAALALLHLRSKAGAPDDPSDARPAKRLRRTTRKSDRERRDAYEMVAEGRRWRVWAFGGGSSDELPEGDERAELRAPGLYFESPVELRFLAMEAGELPNYKHLQAMKGADLRALLRTARPVKRRATEEP